MEPRFQLSTIGWMMVKREEEHVGVEGIEEF